MKIEFDYRFDTNNFFGSPGSPQRQALERAGEIWSSKLNDDFETIPAGVQFEVQNPQTGIYETITLEREIDDLLIFVGASATPFEAEDLGGTGTRPDGTELFKAENLGILAKAKYDGVNLDNVADVFQRRISGNFRQTGGIATDFEPWVGAISFGTTPPQGRQWDFSVNEQDLDPEKFDFVSVAIHEIGHILGIGTAPAFDAIGEGASFDGVNTLASNNNQPVELEEDLGHVKDGFNDDQVLLDPILNQGRNQPSAIDFAMLADIGYEIDGFIKQGSQPALATANAETIFGASFSDDVNGLAGNDLIIGNKGDDLLFGSVGNDTIAGDEISVNGLEDDTTTIKDDNDNIFGNDGNDSLLGGSGNDTIDGGLKSDEIFGEDGSDSLLGGNGNDTLNGGLGEDILRGHDDDDLLFGGRGADLLWGLEGNDSLQGNVGEDTLKGGNGADFLFGQDGDDELNGDPGDDYLGGGTGSDTLDSGAGNDTLFGEAEADRFVFNLNSGNDLVEDFIVGEDIIEISSKYGFADSEAVLDATNIITTFSNGFDSRIQLDNNNFVDVFHDKPLTAADIAVNFPLQVADFNPISNGFEVQFNETIDLDVLNLRNTTNGDTPDLSLVRNSTGEEVEGSVVWDESRLTLTFIQTEGILTPDDYRLTLFSGENSFVSNGEILDGDRDGNNGGNFTTQFTIPQSDRRILSIDDFNQELGANSNSNLKVSLDNGSEVTQVEFTLAYNPDILDITDVTANPDGWQVTSKNLNTPGQATISLTGTTPLNSGEVDLVSLQTAIPATASYGTYDLLKLEAIALNGGTIDVVGDNGIQLNLLEGDTNRDGISTNSDAVSISRVAVGLDDSFASFNLLDPQLIADVNDDGVISAFDSFLVANE